MKIDESGLTDEQKIMAQTLLVQFQDKEQLKLWVHSFLDLNLPDSFVEPESNSSPIDWMWETYKAYRDNRGNEIPSTIIISSRESYKTLTMSINAVIMMLHFGATICHMAAIVPQATAVQKYMADFFRKLAPYMTYNNKEIKSENVKEIKIKNEDGTEVWMKIVVCSLTGANSSHSNFLCVSGKTRILIKNPEKNSFRDRISVRASKLFKMLEAGQKVEAFSYNEQTSKNEFKEITNWYNTGKKDGIELTLANGRKILTTKDHRFFTASGYVEARDMLGLKAINVCKKRSYTVDTPISNCLELPSIKYNEPDDVNPVEQVIIGGLLGDMGIYRRKNYNQMKQGKPTKLVGNSYLKFQHGVKQESYATWKAGIMSNQYPFKRVSAYSGYTKKVLVGFTSGMHEELNKYIDIRKTLNGIEKLEAQGLAILFMDNGTRNGVLATCSFGLELNLKLSNFLKQKFDIKTSVKKYPKKDGRSFYSLYFDIEAMYKLYKITEKYIHPTMMYKFENVINGAIKKCKGCNNEFLMKHSHYCYNKFCQSLKNKSIRQSEVVSIKPAKYNRDYFDFTVKDNHNFFSNGILVHNCIDEVDTIRSAEGVRAYKEASFIPGVFNGQFPMTLKTSTMKFPGGLFTKEMDLAKEKKWPIYKWNILDITEKCPTSRHLPDEPMVDLYIGKDLPLSTLSIEKFKDLTDKEKEKYTEIKAMKGCATCPLLPVCKSRLANRSEEDKGGLWKPIDFTITQFEKSDPDLAEAQLLCRRPSRSGMVYPRFLNVTDDGNTLTIEKAYKVFFGEDYKGKDLTHSKLVKLLVANGVKFVVGVDWGFTNAFAMVVVARIPNGQWWAIESVAQPGLEFDDCLKLALEVRDKYKPKSWYCDNAMPAFIKTFKKNKMPCPEFKKDVLGGIEAVRLQIVDSSGKRNFFVIESDKTKTLMNSIMNHTFKLDAIGEVTDQPDDEMGVADVADALRYVGQNAFPKKGKNSYTPVVESKEEVPDSQKWVSVEIKRLTVPTEPIAKPKRLILDIDEE